MLYFLHTVDYWYLQGIYSEILTNSQVVWHLECVIICVSSFIKGENALFGIIVGTKWNQTSIREQ